ncbi:hypothetical protein [Kitasatospora sp. CB01950]|nr:hypothetical protein [Kitasatospora sp. CB01950]
MTTAVRSAAATAALSALRVLPTLPLLTVRRYIDHGLIYSACCR